MSRSMTGYGLGEYQVDDFHFSVELKSVNSKYCEIKVHSPRDLLKWEHEIAATIKKSFSRGRFDVFVQYSSNVDKGRLLDVNPAVAGHYVELLARLQSKLPQDQTSTEINLNHLLYFKDIFVTPKLDDEKMRAAVFTSLDTAIAALEKMSHEEGQTLKSDMLSRVDTILGHLKELEKKRDTFTKETQKRLQQRIEKLLGEVEVDPQRLAQEVAILADRSDITEELVRLRSHADRLKKTLKVQNPMGRQLEFMIQELHRETNTIGQKSQDYGIADTVITIKSEIEKIREQVHNIE